MAAGDDTRGFNAFQADGESPDAMEFLNDPDGILISRRFADDHHLKTGDRFPILPVAGRRDFPVRGILTEKGPVQAFGGQVAVMDLYTAETAFGRGKHVDRIDVKVTAGANVDSVIAGIKSAVGPGPTVGRPERKSKSVEMMLRSFQVGLYMGSTVSLLVGLFLVFNTMSFAVTQRRREIGTLRALGVGRAAIAALFAAGGRHLRPASDRAARHGESGDSLARATIASALKGINDAYMSINVADASVSRRLMGLGLVLGIGGSIFASLIGAGASRPRWSRRWMRCGAIGCRAPRSHRRCPGDSSEWGWLRSRSRCCGCR